MAEKLRIAPARISSLTSLSSRDSAFHITTAVSEGVCVLGWAHRAPWERWVLRVQRRSRHPISILLAWLYDYDSIFADASF